jgi:hypothetical protein
MEQQKLNVWNTFDEFGLLVGLGHWSNDGRELKYVRYPGETNSQLKERILDVYKHKANSSYQGLINGLSRDFLLPRYNVVTQYFYYLTEEPYPQCSGIKVYTSGNGSWTELLPQVRASGYAGTTSGWIVWNYPDHDTNYGNYTQILEILSGSLPADETPLRIEYQVLDYYDNQGTPTLKWKTDMDSVGILDDDEYKFRVKKATTPNPSSQIVIHRLNNLANDPFSGTWYTSEFSATSKLKEVAGYLNNKHPNEWGKIPWNTLTWENTENLSQGVIPTLFDAELPNDTSGFLDLTKFIGGTSAGPDLCMVGIQKVEDAGHTGIYAHWYPIIYPGKFYIYNNQTMSTNDILSGSLRPHTDFYLFENKKEQFITLTSNSGSISNLLEPVYSDLIVVAASGYSGTTGNYFSELYHYPYGSGQTYNSQYIYNRQYNIYDKINKKHTFNSGEYYINSETGFISGVLLSGNIHVVWEDIYSSGIGKIMSGIDLNLYNIDRESNILYFG